jgi:alkylated DNA repair dioxygenase AlkB
MAGTQLTQYGFSNLMVSKAVSCTAARFARGRTNASAATSAHLARMAPAAKQLPTLLRHLTIMTTRRLASAADLPEGFLYQAEFLSEAEEAELRQTIERLEFGAYNFRGYIARRRVVTYGAGYDSGSRRMVITGKAIPDFLTPIRERAAIVADMRAEEIGQAMVTEYSVGTPIGWHRDSPQFETIIGISIGSACRMRLKPYKGEGKVISVMLEPRSIYVMRGRARWQFQHSIPAVKELRYSITFRSLMAKEKACAA